MDVAKFKAQPLLGIIRGIEADMVEPLVEAACGAGLKTIEITMNTPGAADLIRKAVESSSGRLTIGAGTVLSVDDLNEAVGAGATFIVSPTLVDDVAWHCVKNRIPFFPGALTPQEIYNAWQAGAAMVKVFPVKFFGPEYFREVKAPFNDIELLACSGVTPENMGEYFACGASAVSFGANVFRPEWLKSGDFAAIASAINRYIKALPLDLFKEYK